MTRVHEDPRVTKPYTDAQWAAIDALGRAGRRAISRAHDVRLTQGGEPTFVSIDDMDGAGVELHGAVAEEARAGRDAAAPARRRASRRGGFLHYGQGKWYPGEPLPRWALGVCWRADGEPLWRDAGADRRHARAGQRRHRRRAALRDGDSRSGSASIRRT